jgi:pSer/pThr/pTyr-binding forkhead associated (FHA) protein
MSLDFGKSRRINVIVCLLSICCWMMPAGGLEIPEVAQIAKQSTYLVVNRGIDDKIQGQGTGFVLGKDRLLVTNFHVIADAGRVGILMPDGSESDLGIPIAHDKIADVAVFRLARNLSNVPYLNLYEGAPEVGEKVVVLGYPKALKLRGGFEPTLSTGIVSSFRSYKDTGPVMQVTAAISPGSSGSPVMTENGRVIGIATWFFDDGQSINFAIPASTLDRVIRQHLPYARLSDTEGSEVDHSVTTILRPQPSDVSTYSPPATEPDEELSLPPHTPKPLEPKSYYGFIALVIVGLGIASFVVYRYSMTNTLDPTGWVLVGSPSGRREPVRKTMLLGRGAGSDILLPGNYVSQRHAELSIREGGELWVKDLDSKNGTKVNDQRVATRRLKAGDQIDIGGNAFRVEKSSWVLVGSPSGRRESVHKTMLLGRGTGSDILLEGNFVSQRHAEISIREGGELWIKDLDSKNGTKVNGQRVATCKLKEGSRIDVAGNVFHVERSG